MQRDAVGTRLDSTRTPDGLRKWMLTGTLLGNEYQARDYSIIEPFSNVGKTVISWVDEGIYI